MNDDEKQNSTWRQFKIDPLAPSAKSQEDRLIEHQDKVSKALFIMYHIFGFIGLVVVGAVLFTENAKIRSSTGLPNAREAEIQRQRNETLDQTVDAIMQMDWRSKNRRLDDAVESFHHNLELLPSRLLPSDSKYYLASYFRTYPNHQLLVFMPRDDLELEVLIQTIFNGKVSDRTQKITPQRQGWIILELAATQGANKFSLTWRNPLSPESDPNLIEVPVQGKLVSGKIAEVEMTRKRTDPDYNQRQYAGLFPISADSDPFEKMQSAVNQLSDRLKDISYRQPFEHPGNRKAPVLMRKGILVANPDDNPNDSSSGRVNVIVTMKLPQLMQADEQE